MSLVGSKMAADGDADAVVAHVSLLLRLRCRDVEMEERDGMIWERWIMGGIGFGRQGIGWVGAGWVLGVGMGWGGVAWEWVD